MKQVMSREDEHVSDNHGFGTAAFGAVSFNHHHGGDESLEYVENIPIWLRTFTASHSCEPSCEVKVVAVNGELSLAITSLRNVECLEELTFDYHAVTESVNEYHAAICLCGNTNCRGSFLHFATADCYQEVLNRNSPIAVRFSSLVKGCMKQVMSREDEHVLDNHGFGTAAFGAVSFNHHHGTWILPSLPKN